MKPVGTNPIVLDGIVLRKSDEMLVKHPITGLELRFQALYDESSGQLLWVGFIGSNPDRSIRATAITVSPIDYEIAVKSYRERPMIDAARRFNR